MATKLTYKEQLLHTNWQRKRLEMLNAAGWKCVSCEAADQTLHVHHKRYIKGRMAWEYDESELAVLCDGCHRQEHDDMQVADELLAASDTAANAALIAGFLSHADWIEPGLIEQGRQSDPLMFAAGFVAYLVHALCDMDDMRKVAEFAAELNFPHAEARMVYQHRRGNIFGENCA